MAQDPSWYTNIHSLSSNVELITAAANDMGYDSIFSYQLERKALQGDVLVVFTVSGNSANIVRAAQCATELGIQTIAVTACDGGKVAGMTDATIHIPTSNYGIAEDVMQMVMHSLAQFIRQTRMSDRAIQSARF
jgi:phosphoheptose isomerase